MDDFSIRLRGGVFRSGVVSQDLDCVAKGGHEKIPTPQHNAKFDRCKQAGRQLATPADDTASFKPTLLLFCLITSKARINKTYEVNMTFGNTFIINERRMCDVRTHVRTNLARSASDILKDK